MTNRTLEQAEHWAVLNPVQRDKGKHYRYAAQKEEDRP